MTIAISTGIRAAVLLWARTRPDEEIVSGPSNQEHETQKPLSMKTLQVARLWYAVIQIQVGSRV